MLSSTDIEFGPRVAPRDLLELIDGDCSYEDFRGCLSSLEQINRWLLGIDRLWPGSSSYRLD
ncbi:MAG: hypothetical protein ACLPY1_18950 [Terracidiphilus sp.]